jgi:hypothetical protein
MKKWVLRLSMVFFIAGVIWVFVVMDNSKNYDFGIAELGGRTATADGKANNGWGLPIWMR